MAGHEHEIVITAQDVASKVIEGIERKLEDLNQQDTTVDIGVGSGFYETQEQIRNTRGQLDKLREAYDTLSTKSSKVSSSRSLKKYTEEAKTLNDEIKKIYREINSESVNESIGDALYRDSRRLQKSLSQRLESAKATEKENAALRRQAQEIQRVNSAYQEFYATVSRVKALNSGGANGAYSYNAFNADGTPASTNVAGLLGAATNFTMRGVPYDSTIGQAIMAYPANPYAGTGYTLGGSYGGKSSYRATGTINKNPNVIYVDDFGNVSYTPPSKAIPALPAGTPDMTDYSELSEVRGGFGSNGFLRRIGKNGKPAQGLFEEVLGTSLGNYFKRIATYQAVSATVYGTVQAFKDALGTMKEVDSELASIQKVTDFDAEQMKSIEESAYDVASQYGVSAQEYLESVSAFAKAGYKDLADDLGELAIKTQLVGDVTASTANQFLLSVDAAWKMNGSVEDLSKVLDEANVVENNYATSIDKLAQGMPNVASVASMAGMSAEQTVAALGTITAVTQQSGTKAATALRALILNIMKDTTTEVEDGVTLTKEQLTSLDDVLHEYAQEALNAANATGEIVNPMEVVAALAKAYKENRITDQDLAKIEMSLGGKLRTNQLDALLKNFDTIYEGMMGKMATAAGSANKEIGVMLDTWTAKSNILQNTWTKFIADTLDTRFFKNILDFATDALNSVGNLQNALVVLGGTISSFSAIKNADKITEFFEKLGVTGVSGGALGIAGAVATVGYMAFTQWRQGIDNAADESAETAKESAQKARDVLSLVSTYESATEGSLAFKEASSQLAAALGLEGDAVSSLKEKYKDLVYGEGGVLAKARTDATKALMDAEKALDTQFNTTNYSVRRNGGKLAKKYGDINDLIDANLAPFWNQSQGRYDAGFNREQRLAYYDAVKKSIEEVDAAASKLGTTEQKEIFASGRYKDLLNAYSELGDYVKNYRGQLVSKDVTDKIVDGTINSIQAFEVYRETLKRTIDDEETLQATLEVLDSAFPQFASKVADTTNALNGNAGAANEATNALERYKKALSEGGEKNDKFNDIIDAAQKMAEAGKQGYFGSNAFQEGAKLAFGKDYASSHSGEEIVEHYEKLQKMGVFDKDSMGRGLKNLITSSDAAEVEGNLTRIRDAAGEVIAEISDNGDGTFGFDITNTETGLGELERILGVSKEHIIAMQEAMGMFDASIDTKNLEDQFNGIFEDVEKLAEPVEMTVTDKGTSRAVLEGLNSVNAIADALDGKVVTVTERIVQEGGFVGGGGGKSFGGGGGGNGGDNGGGNGGRASGDKNFKGGLVLVNEQAGGFNPELIEVGDKSFFVNGGRPALVSLPKGAIIHNATETRKLFAKDYMEVPHYETGTRIPVGDIARRSGKVAGIGSGKGSASSSDWWEKLQQYMEDLLEKAGDALDKQLEAIDAELFYLQYGKEVSEKATKLEEARMDLLEAEQELINAQTERTVRYFNAETGQWEWMADQKDILKAQEDLAEKQKDYLQAQYDYLEDVWSELKDDIQKAIDGKTDVNIANVLKQMLKSKAGGLTGNVEGVIGDLLSLITAYESGTALDSYDSGGIANGLGYMFKATKADEVVLNGKLSSAILSPKRSQQFSDFTSSLERMFGMSQTMERPQSRLGISTSDNHSTNVYMNGIKIGSDMLNKPLSEVLSVLPIYCN